jgi:hypothetical protein
MADSDEMKIDDDEFIKIFKDSDDENEFETFEIAIRSLQNTGNKNDLCRNQQSCA